MFNFIDIDIYTQPMQPNMDIYSFVVTAPSPDYRYKALLEYSIETPDNTQETYQKGQAVFYVKKPMSATDYPQVCDIFNGAFIKVNDPRFSGSSSLMFQGDIYFIVRRVETWSTEKMHTPFFMKLTSEQVHVQGYDEEDDED